LVNRVHLAVHQCLTLLGALKQGEIVAEIERIPDFLESLDAKSASVGPI
jgi:hypothetical protein